MNKEEAHEVLEDFQRLLTNYRHISSELIEANGIAILAVEKQIPEKFDEHFKEKDGYFYCSSTTKIIRYPLVSFKNLQFCPACGQRIDWSNNND